ncbi:MAG: class I SAM-dependent methyltransferase [Sedimentisphaerales bacterium]|nr:class I SAM-dependent methyltransferase [Sedimentisphaerales bacterium]
MNDQMRITDENGVERDFFFEVSKYSGYLWRSHIERHLAIYELYRKTCELPGSIVEFGVFNGSTYFFLARLLEIFNRPSFEKYGSCAHHLYGFDTFEGIVELDQRDETVLGASQRKVGGFAQDPARFLSDLERFKQANAALRERLHVVKGDVCDTFPAFLTDNPGVRFRFVLLDMDIFKPTDVVLQAIYDYMVPGGIIGFDEYGFPEWPGETAAVDRFLKKHNLKPQSIPWAFAPSAYCIV